MNSLSIESHTPQAWNVYRQQIGFVPDPMILRAGIFLNGSQGVQKLNSNQYDVWGALSENIAGIIDFFDIVVCRDTIPLINYYDTYDRMSVATAFPKRRDGVIDGDFHGDTKHYPINIDNLSSHPKY